MMEIGIFIALVIIAICEVVKTIQAFINKKSSITRYEEEQGVEDDILNELMMYCHEKGIDAFIDTTTSQNMTIACEKDEKILPILEVKFPMSKKGSREYLSALEFQKEQIDNFIRRQDVKVE